MTPRSLFIIILRVIGILFLKELLIAIPQLITSVLSYFSRYSSSDGIFILFFSLLTVILYLWISYHLIFKADKLVSQFALDKGFFEDTFQLSLSIRSILLIAIIVTGALILFINIPDLCQIVYGIMSKQDIPFLSTGEPTWTPAVFSGVKVILGLLIIGERKRIVAHLMTSTESDEIKQPPSVLNDPTE